VEVRVDDVTSTDVPTSTTLLGSTRFEPAGQVPIPFEIKLSKELADTPSTYAVSAWIYGPDGRLLFVSNKAYRLSAGAPESRVDLLLVPSGRPR
jgi:uncharacterized lipoprotein YbaY